jgi:hypothetical protein
MNRLPDVGPLVRGGRLALGLALGCAAALHGQEPARASARGVHLRIETDRPTYHVGDTIRVRLTLQNRSGAAVEYNSQPPIVQARLRVLDAAGVPVPPGPSRAAQDLPSTRPVTIAAGQKSTLRWLDREWLSLEDWGYDLRTPGRYTIVGVPGVAGPALTPDYETVRSNRATITILP